MNRRDTIIIAVLLNAGLLIVLFATSVKSDKIEEVVPTTVLSSNQPEQSMQAPVAAASKVSAGTDQLDHVLQQYVTPQVTGQTETQPNFLADLQALGTETSTPVPVMERAPAIVESQTAGLKFSEVTVKKDGFFIRLRGIKTAEITKQGFGYLCAFIPVGE